MRRSKVHHRERGKKRGRGGDRSNKNPALQPLKGSLQLPALLNLTHTQKIQIRTRECREGAKEKKKKREEGLAGGGKLRISKETTTQTRHQATELIPVDVSAFGRMHQGELDGGEGGESRSVLKDGARIAVPSKLGLVRNQIQFRWSGRQMRLKRKSSGILSVFIYDEPRERGKGEKGERKGNLAVFNKGTTSSERS